MLFLFLLTIKLWMNLLASVRISVSKREQTDYILPLDQRIGEFILAAKFLTTRFLNMNVVARTLKQIWRSTNGFKIRHHGDLRILFVFDNLSDVDKILHKATFWVQVHDIAVRFITKKVAENICETVGEVHKSTGAIGSTTIIRTVTCGFKPKGP